VNRTAGPATAAARLWLAAAATGVVATLATLAFHAGILAIEFLSTASGSGLVAAARGLSPGHRFLVSSVGAMLAGLVLQGGGLWAARGASGGTHIDYIDAAREGKVALNDRTTLVRSFSSLISVGTGASIGREGPMVQLAAWLATWVGRIFPMPPADRNVLLACGIAAGIGSAYHAPVAGMVFVLELALGFLPRRSVVPVLVAAGTSSGLLAWWTGPLPLYTMPSMPLVSTNLGMAILEGALGGVLGWLFLRLLEVSRRVFLGIGSPTVRLALGGVLVGLISVGVPEVWGNGYSVVSQILREDSAWSWVALILAAKFAATILSAGSGAIGGVFTPTLFLGAASGHVLSHFAAMVDPALSGDPRAVGVIGMAAALAAVTHAPLMSIVMVLEMTNQFSLTVPVMFACGVAYAISTRFGAMPLYGNPIEGRAA